MKKITIFLITITAMILTCCQLTGEEVVNIRVHGYVKDKVSNSPLDKCSIYISNGYIDEEDEYAISTDSSGYFTFTRDVWKNYSTDISAYCSTYTVKYITIDNNKDNEINFLLEKY